MKIEVPKFFIQDLTYQDLKGLNSFKVICNDGEDSFIIRKLNKSFYAQIAKPDCAKLSLPVGSYRNILNLNQKLVDFIYLCLIDKAWEIRYQTIREISGNYEQFYTFLEKSLELGKINPYEHLISERRYKEMFKLLKQKRIDCGLDFLTPKKTMAAQK